MPIILESYTSHDELIVDHSSSGRVIVVRDAQNQARLDSANIPDRPIIVRIRIGNFDHFVAVYENGAMGEADAQMKQPIRWQEKQGNTAPESDRVYITMPREYLGLSEHNATGSRTFDIIGFQVERSGLTLCTKCYLDPATLAMASADDQAIDSMDDLHSEGPVCCDVCGHMLSPGQGPYIGCDDDIDEIRLAMASKARDLAALTLLRKRIKTLEQLRAMLQSCQASAARRVAEHAALLPDQFQMMQESLGTQHGYDLALALLAGIDDTADAITNSVALMINQRDLLITITRTPYQASYTAALSDSIDAINDLLMPDN